MSSLLSVMSSLKCRNPQYFLSSLKTDASPELGDGVVTVIGDDQWLARRPEVMLAQLDEEV